MIKSRVEAIQQIDELIEEANYPKRLSRKAWELVAKKASDFYEGRSLYDYEGWLYGTQLLPTCPPVELSSSVATLKYAEFKSNYNNRVYDVCLPCLELINLDGLSAKISFGNDRRDQDVAIMNQHPITRLAQLATIEFVLDVIDQHFPDVDEPLKNSEKRYESHNV